MFLEFIISLPSLFSLEIVFAVALFFSRLAKNLVFFSPPSIYSALALTIYPFTFFSFISSSLFFLSFKRVLFSCVLFPFEMFCCISFMSLISWFS